MRVTYVTGTSCAGKTTLGDAFSDREREDYGLMIYDLDRDAPCRPSTAWLSWLQWRAAELLHSAAEEDGPYDCNRLVVTGIVWPLRVIESPAWRPAKKAGVAVDFALLHPPWRLVKERLVERGEAKRELKALRNYNRGLRSTLRDQVEAVRYGNVIRDVGVDQQVDQLLDRGRLDNKSTGVLD